MITKIVCFVESLSVRRELIVFGSNVCAHPSADNFKNAGSLSSYLLSPMRIKTGLAVMGPYDQSYLFSLYPMSRETVAFIASDYLIFLVDVSRKIIEWLSPPRWSLIQSGTILQRKMIGFLPLGRKPEYLIAVVALQIGFAVLHEPRIFSIT